MKKQSCDEPSWGFEETPSSYMEEVLEQLAHAIALGKEERGSLEQIDRLRLAWLDHFKRKMGNRERVDLWDRYRHLLSKWALVQVREEQDPLFYKKFEKQLAEIKEKIEKEPPLSQIGEDLSHSLALQEHSNFYAEKISHFCYYKGLFDDVHELYLELVHKNISLKTKRTLFAELGKLEKKRSLRCQEIGEPLQSCLVRDINSWIGRELPSSRKGLFAAKEEIRILQKILEKICEDPSLFVQTRSSLSLHWERVKEKEKQLREGVLDRIEVPFEQKLEGASQKEAFLRRCLESKTLEEILQIEDEMLASADIFRRDSSFWQELNEQLSLRRYFLEQKKQKKEEIEDPFSIEQRRVREYLQQIEDTVNLCEGLESEALVKKWDNLLKTKEEVLLTKSQRDWVCHRLDVIADHILEKKVHTLLVSESCFQREGLEGLLSEARERCVHLEHKLAQWHTTFEEADRHSEESRLDEELFGAEEVRLDFLQEIVQEILGVLTQDNN